MQHSGRIPFFSPALRLVLISFLFNLSMETSGIFLPLRARSLGASDFEVGLIVASYGMAYFISCLLFGRESDFRGRMPFIRYGLILAAVAYVPQLFAPTPMTLLIARGAVGFCLGVSSAALMAYVYEAGGEVGSVASYGSLGWFFGAVVAAAIRNVDALFIASAIASGIAFLISLTLREERVSPIRVAVFPVRTILANRRIYLPFLLRHTGAAAIWSIFPIYLQGIGASLSMIAVINGINSGGQFVFMQLIRRFKPVRIFIMGLAASVIVFAVYGVATNYLQLIPVQILLALAWSGLLVGALNYLLWKNVERGTAVGLLYSTHSLAGGIGPLLGGVTSQAWGFPALMYVSSGLSFVSLLAARGLGAAKGKKREG
jgi:MFS family permease